ncbi:MAG: glycosyltransferase family 2 protein [Actinomycetota bacterium]
MRAALVIVNYNTAPDLRRCLQSAAERLAGVEVLVVDNGSTDGSREMVRDGFPHVRLVENPGNPGYASACNRGIAATSQPYVFILNSDVEFLSGGLDEVLDRMESDPAIGALGPMVLNSDGSVQMSCRRFPSMFASMVHGFLGDIWPGNPLTMKYQMKNMCRDGPCEVDWISGAAMLLRREAAERVGGFDETYFMYVEDVDICWRLREAGYRVVYDPAMRLLHHIGRTSSQQSVRMLYQHHRSMFIYCRKRYRGGRGMALLPLVLAGLAARFTLALLLRAIRREGKGG